MSNGCNEVVLNFKDGENTPSPSVCFMQKVIEHSSSSEFY